MRRPVESDLGDVIGEPIKFVAYRRDRAPPRWIENGTSLVIAWVAIVLFLALVMVAVVLSFLFAAQPSLAHGPADWIQNGGYKNSAGELCCGARDCFELTDTDVKVTAAGYYVVSIKETVPFSEATPSPDGRYWRCAWGGKRKCFFAPPGST